MMTDEELLEALKKRINTPGRETFMRVYLAEAFRELPYEGQGPLLSEMELAWAEHTLGFKLPAIYRKIHGSLGSGGFGPGYGLLGLIEAWGDGIDESVLSIYASCQPPRRSKASKVWPKTMLPIVHWGCTTYACIDCSIPEAPVFHVELGCFEFDSSKWVFSEWSKLENPSLFQWLEEWATGKLTVEGIGGKRCPEAPLVESIRG